jgi:hypothetical protein
MLAELARPLAISKQATVNGTISAIVSFEIVSAALTHPKAVSVSPTLGPFSHLVAIRGPPVEKGRIVALSPLLVRTSTSA